MVTSQAQQLFSCPEATFQHKSCHSAAHVEGEIPGTGHSFGSDG